MRIEGIFSQTSYMTQLHTCPRTNTTSARNVSMACSSNYKSQPPQNLLIRKVIADT
jgi:hypothetical protein